MSNLDLKLALVDLLTTTKIMAMVSFRVAQLRAVWLEQRNALVYKLKLFSW